ncbi:MAG: efflux RND transporter periplasmic adaptor subunit [Nitrospirae bacterium]|nr:efflux RND transporter periplasmic adaptor subunit [Nitrospirota bacterium]
MKKYMAISILIIFLPILLISSGCSKKEDGKNSTERVINVITQPAEKKSLRPFVEAVGTLTPYEEVNISSEVDGRVTSVSILSDEGSVVNKGALLATVDDTDYTLAVKQSESALRQAEVSLANTKIEHTRKSALNREGLITKEEFDTISTRVSLSDAEVDKAKTVLDITKQRLSKTKIYSPIAGVIKEKRVSSGDNVRMGSNLFTIIQNDPLKLSFTVSERDAGKLKTGQDTSFKVDSLNDRVFNGRLSLIYPNLDDKTRTLRAEAVVPNSSGVLRPGLFARVTLYTASARSSVVVPVTAMLYEADQVKIFTVDGDIAREKFVKTGIRHGDLMEITEGLKEGEKVVIVGQQNLSDGVKVRINVAR